MGNNNSKLEIQCNQDININGNLNIYICGDINNNDNYNILTNIFNIEDSSLNGYIKINNKNRPNRYFYEYRRLKHKIKTIDEKEEKTKYNAFLFINNDVDELFSHVLFYHFYEKDTHNKRNNVIINFGPPNNIQNKMNELIESSRESIPFVIHINNDIQNYDEQLKYVNYIPGLDSINNNLKNDNPNINQNILNESLKRYINLKLYRINAYYKEMGYNLNLINPLNEMNSRIKLHLTIALCGYSGCGKSTLLNLIFRELVSKSVSSATDVSTKCTEYYLPVQNINNENNNIGQIRFLDFPGITKNDNYKNVVEKSINEKIIEYKKNLEQIDVALFFISNGVGREFTESGKKLVNLLYNNRIRIIFIINGPINEFILKEKKNKMNNLIKEKKILGNNCSNILSTNFYQYHEHESRNGIREIFEKIIEIIQIQIPNYNVENINIKNYNEQLELLRNNCRVFELFENMSVMKKSAKIQSSWLVVLYSLLTCGSSPSSIIVPLLDAGLTIGYQLAMIFNIFYVYDLNPDDYNISQIFLSAGKDISNINEIDKPSKKEKEKENEKEDLGHVILCGDVVMKGSKFALEKAVEQIVKETGQEATIELAKQGLTQGVKQISTEIVKETIKESTIIATKESVEGLAIQSTKQTIAQLTQEIAIKEGGKRGWIYLGKAIPFIGAGISCLINTISTGKLGYRLVNYCDNDFENNQIRKVNMLKGRVLALENIIQQMREIN